MKRGDAIEPFKKTLQCLAACAACATNLERFEDDSPQSGDGPPIKRGGVNLLTFASAGKKFGSSGERQQFLPHQFPCEIGRRGIRIRLDHVRHS